MQILRMRIELNGMLVDIEREDQTVGGVSLRHVRVIFEGEEGGQCLGVADRATAFDLATDIARDTYGKRRSGAPACTNSMISDIADAVERVAGC